MKNTVLDRLQKNSIELLDLYIYIMSYIFSYTLQVIVNLCNLCNLCNFNKNEVFKTYQNEQ